MKKSEITVSVELDDNNIPEKLVWNAKDGGVVNQETKAALISVWDDENQEAMRLDLWTKDMPMDDMKMFFHQVFISLSETYERATGEDDIAQTIIEFAENFAMLNKLSR